jgi:hypothetical protein
MKAACRRAEFSSPCIAIRQEKSRVAKEVLKASGTEDVSSTGESSVDKGTDRDVASKAARGTH